MNRLRIPLLLTTFGALVLQIALTRLFSVVLFYHYAFLVISVALLGFAVGGLAARLVSRTTNAGARLRLVGLAAIVGAVLLVPILSLILSTNLWLVTTWAAFERLSMLYLACMLPFALAGFATASVVALGIDEIGTLYFYDLLGAGLGALAVVPLLSVLGGPNTVLMSAAIWALAGCAWAIAAGSRKILGVGTAVMAALVSLVAFNRDGTLFDVRYLRGAPKKNEVFAKWNSFSRVSAFREATGEYWIEIDGGAGTWISDIDLDGPPGETFAANLGRSGPDLGFWLARPKTALVIGPGGGIDLARAIAAGTRRVVAVEINPIIVRDVMQGAFREHSHNLYGRPEVTVSIEDGRTFVERSRELFDAVQLSQVDTWASSASGAYALTENYLYTVEAVDGYLRRLSPTGILSISRWEFPLPRETLRLVSVYIEALRRSGIRRPGDHLIVAMERIDPEGKLRMGTVLARRTPFTAEEISRLVERTQGSAVSFEYLPGRGGGASPFATLIATDEREGFYRQYPFNVRPVFDDAPFFFFSGRWRHTLRGMFQFDPTGDTLNTGAQFLLIGIFFLASAMVALFLFVARRTVAGTDTASRLGLLLYFVAIGVGYIIIEIALIQKFVVFLGQPAYSLTVTVFVLLVSSSLGSRLSQQLRIASWPAAVVAGLTIVAWLTIPLLVSSAQALEPSFKIALVCGAIAPLGFAMGIPFPIAMRFLGEAHPDLIEWAWALNASATVVGSVLAMLLSVTLGISRALLCAGLAYAVATTLLSRQAHLGKKTT